MVPACYEEWKNKYGQSVLEDYAKNTGRSLLEKQSEIVSALKGQLEDFYKDLVNLQSRTPFQVGCVQGALLYSSVVCGRPAIRYEAYDEAQEFGSVLAAKEYPADWLFTEWEALREKLVESIAANGLSGCLTEEAADHLKNAQLDSCMYTLTYTAKYIFKEMEQFSGFPQLVTTEEYYVSMGAYRDFRKLLYRKRKDMDLCASVKERDFAFCKFQSCVYREKKIWGANLNQAVFTDCRFRKTDFSGCDLRDCEFRSCSFEDVHVTDSSLQGARWEDCTLKGVTFSGCPHESGMVFLKEKVKDICRNAAFLWSELTDCEFTDSGVETWEFLECNVTGGSEDEGEL